MKTRLKTIAAFCFIILLIPSGLKAQDRIIDSLKVLLSKAGSDSAKVKLLNKLCYQLGTIDNKKAYDYGKQAITLAAKIDFKTGLCLAYNNFGIIYDQRGQGDSALIYYNKCLVMSKELNNVYLQSSGLSNIGYI